MKESPRETLEALNEDDTDDDNDHSNDDDNDDDDNDDDTEDVKGRQDNVYEENKEATSSFLGASVGTKGGAGQCDLAIALKVDATTNTEGQFRLKKAGRRLKAAFQAQNGDGQNGKIRRSKTFTTAE